MPATRPWMEEHTEVVKAAESVWPSLRKVFRVKFAEQVADVPVEHFTKVLKISNQDHILQRSVGILHVPVPQKRGRVGEVPAREGSYCV